MIITNQNLVSNSKGLKISHCTKCNNAFYNTSNYCNTFIFCNKCCNTLIFIFNFTILIVILQYLGKLQYQNVVILLQYDSIGPTLTCGPYLLRICDTVSNVVLTINTFEKESKYRHNLSLRQKIQRSKLPCGNPAIFKIVVVRKSIMIKLLV